MAGFFNKLFDKHTVVTEAVARLVGAAGKALKGFLVVIGHAQAFAAAAGASLDHHRVPNTLRNFNRFFGRLDGAVDSGDAIDTGRASQLFRLDLVAHGGHGVVLGPNEDDAFFFHPLGKFGVLAQKSVTGV